MRTLLPAFFLASLLAPAVTLTGWISDASCGAANANAKAESRECAKACLKNGAKPVFVADADQKVYQLEGADVKAHLDNKVKLTGEVKGDVLRVEKVEKAN